MPNIRPNRTKQFRTALAFGSALLGWACGHPTPQGTPAAATRPSLLLFITVDQFRPEYLSLFKGQLTGGLARLERRGAYFTEAFQDYAITETAPGHASTMSGRFPRSTGITRNAAGVGDPKSKLIGSNDPGASPFRFRGTTVTDWLTAANPSAKVLSVSAKDRGAILPIGRSKQNVFWYANNGIFTTSSWYADTLPSWVRAFNARDLARGWAGRSWDLSQPKSMYGEPDSVAQEADGKDIAFPHVFPADSNRTAYLVRFTPMVDQLTAALALEGVRQLNLGAGPGTDILAVSFSATDYVGHFFGPESREQHDQILRLDRLLGGFLDTLYRLRDSSKIVAVLTADHGGTVIPELHGRVKVDAGPAVAAVRRFIAQAGGGADTTAIDLESGGFFVDQSKLGTSLTAARVTDEFLAQAAKLPGVLRVDRFEDLAAKDTTKDYVARRWLHMFAPEAAPKAVVTLEPGNMFKLSSPYPYPYNVLHGVPHDYDSHVPIILVGAPFKPGRYAGFVRTADIAPTLARVLGLTPSEPLDGRPLLQAIR